MESKKIDTKKRAREIIYKAYKDLVELRDNPLRSDRPEMDEESMTNNIFLNTIISFLHDRNMEIIPRIWKDEESKKEVV